MGKKSKSSTTTSSTKSSSAFDGNEISFDEKKNRKVLKSEKNDKEKDKLYNAFLKRSQLIEEKKNLERLYLSESRDVHCRNITITAGQFSLLDDANLKLSSGRKYGLIGRNGTGKSTLLRHIEEGELDDLPEGMQIMHIEQEVMGDDITAVELLLKTDVERERLLAEEKKILSENKDGGRLTEIYARMEEIEAHEAESRASSLLYGLGFSPEMQKMKTKDFSGGWRMRLALARALYIEPELLLLDEPTNHLDLHAVLWLENYLISYEKTLLVVSHDRRFLNEVCTDIIHLDNQTLTNYKGDFDSFEEVRAELLTAQQTKYEAQQRQKEVSEKFITRFKASSRAKMVQSRMKMLEKTEFVKEVKEESVFSFEIDSPSEESSPYIHAQDISFAYPGSNTNIFTKMNFKLDSLTRIALVGANGAGKSTFLKVLEGELDPTEGYMTRNSKVRVAKFSQHHVENLDLRKSALEFMQSKFENTESQELRSHLGRLGLSGELAMQPIYTLSGGQKSRIMFAMISFMKPHILLLDEPTNHLDLETIEALIDALNGYGGGVLVVSHDQYLIESLGAEIWVCENNDIKKFNGTFNEYRTKWEKEMNL